VNGIPNCESGQLIEYPPLAVEQFVFFFFDHAGFRKQTFTPCNRCLDFANRSLMTENPLLCRGFVA
jgi:hypothetical protein